MTHDERPDESGFSRRTLMRTTGAAAAAGVGVPSTAARGGFHGEFASRRVREVKKVWDRGYRGRPDRALGLTDSGIDSRHPDLGPWNGVRATIDGDSLVLTGPELESRQRVEADRAPVTDSGGIDPGTFAAGDEVELVQFEVAESDDVDELDAALSWEPYAANGDDLVLRLDVRIVGADGDESWEAVRTAATAGTPGELSGVQLDAGIYRFVAEQQKNVACQYELEANFFRYDGSLETYGDGAVFGTNADGEGVPVQQRSDAPDVAPKTVGWFNETARSGDYERPRDDDGHGSRCASIMCGSGRASQPDPETVIEEKPRTVLTAGDTVEYDIDAEAGTGVFISAYGDGIELVIEGPDGEELAVAEVEVLTASADTSGWDNNVAVAAAEQTGTYSAYVRAAGGQVGSMGRVREVSAGAFLETTAATGDRTAAGETTINAGVSPDASLVGLQGLSDPTISLGEYAGEFARLFNLRSVNVSWGSPGGLPLGAPGQNSDGGVVEAIRTAAENGILTVAAAGNAATPANGSGAPAVADEAISVVSTGPLDGIVASSSGGVYAKPDVTAPGGSVTDSIDAAAVGDPDDESLADGDVRGYTAGSGTSMAGPFTNGVASLVAEAMEFDAPEALSIAEPAAATLEDVMKLKHVILATASETAFTAAPYHRGHAPAYTHGERDPYEGYGRVNPDAAVDAVTRELVGATDLADGDTAEFESTETVGLDLPVDSRAVAGYVEIRGGTLDVDIAFSHYGGGNEGMTRDVPHLDLFVYDSAPGTNGDPSIVASARGETGEASVSVDVPVADAGEDPNEETYFVVAKLVNIPGVVNGYDVQAHFDTNLSFTAGEAPDVTREFTASGFRAHDGSVFTAGQTSRVEITVEEFRTAREIRLRDHIPPMWDVDASVGDVESYDEENGVVTFGRTISADEVSGDSTVTLAYVVEAPETTGRYTFGGAEAEVVTRAVPDDDADGSLDGDGRADVAGTDTSAVVGANTGI